MSGLWHVAFSPSVVSPDPEISGAACAPVASACRCRNRSSAARRASRHAARALVRAATRAPLGLPGSRARSRWKARRQRHSPRRADVWLPASGAYGGRTCGAKRRRQPALVRRVGLTSAQEPIGAVAVRQVRTYRFSRPRWMGSKNSTTRRSATQRSPQRSAQSESTRHPCYQFCKKGSYRISDNILAPRTSASAALPPLG